MPICINKSLIKINGTKRRENILHHTATEKINYSLPRPGTTIIPKNARKKTIETEQMWTAYTRGLQITSFCREWDVNCIPIISK